MYTGIIKVMYYSSNRLISPLIFIGLKVTCISYEICDIFSANAVKHNKYNDQCSIFYARLQKLWKTEYGALQKATTRAK